MSARKFRGFLKDGLDIVDFGRRPCREGCSTRCVMVVVMMGCGLHMMMMVMHRRCLSTLGQARLPSDDG